MQQEKGMEGLRKKKTVYLETLEAIERKVNNLTSNMTAGGIRFFLLSLLYEVQRTNEFFTDVEALVNEKKYTANILDIDADVNYAEWAKNEHWKLGVDAQNLPEDKELEPIERTIWGVLDALPPNGSDQYVEFSRTDYKLTLQQILWSKCSNKQLYFALVNSIQKLRTILLSIGDKQAKRELSLEDGEKLYKGEEVRFNLSEASKVVAEFKTWKSDCEDDDEIILKKIEGKKYTELKTLFKSGFFDCKIEQQSEIDFSCYKEEVDIERLKRMATGMDVEAYYSAMREFFKYNKGVWTPRKDKIGKYFFKHRKEVTDEHRIAYFRFVKMLWLIEEEKKPKAANDGGLNYEGIKVAMNRTYFPKCSAALNKEYNAEWLDNYMMALMNSKHKDDVAMAWANDTTRKQVYCAILGALKDKGVFKGTYAALAEMIYDGDSNETKEDRKRNLRTLGKYIGEGKNHVIGKWTEDY